VRSPGSKALGCRVKSWQSRIEFQAVVSAIRGLPLLRESIATVELVEGYGSSSYSFLRFLRVG
jgi:hypothetical protein